MHCKKTISNTIFRWYITYILLPCSSTEISISLGMYVPSGPTAISLLRILLECIRVFHLPTSLGSGLEGEKAA